MLREIFVRTANFSMSCTSNQIFLNKVCISHINGRPDIAKNIAIERFIFFKSVFPFRSVTIFIATLSVAVSPTENTFHMAKI